jgi:hypothetical protein
MEILLDSAYVFPAMTLSHSPANYYIKVFIAFVTAAVFALAAGAYALVEEVVEYRSDGSE